MAAKGDNIEYDFYIISDDTEWEKKVLDDLKTKKPEIKCLSRKDWKPGEFKLENLIKPVERCKKVVVGFTSKTSTGNQEFVAVTAVQQMLDRNLLNQAKLIPVKITEDAEIPQVLCLITAANGWEECFYDDILKTLYGNDEPCTSYQLPSSQGNDAPSTSYQLPSSQDKKIKEYLLERQKILCSNYKKFTPPIMQDRFQLDITHMFTDLDLVKEDKEGKKKSTPIKLTKVLQNIKSTPECKVLIEGEGGIGKTTLLRHLAYDWSQATENSFAGKIVFLVNIRDIGIGENILDVIVKDIDLKDFNLKTDLPEESKLIKRFLMKHDDEIVLMLDGLDELEEGRESPIKIFTREKLGKSTVILTSRSENINEFINKSDVHVKVKGFNEKKRGKYIKRYFRSNPGLGESLSQELSSTLFFQRRPDQDRVLSDLYSMCRNPMLLLLTCIMWEEKQQIPADKADLFREVFRCILNQYNRETTKINKISMFEEIPKEYVDAMCVLGECMYYGLKKNQLSINKKDLEGNEDVVAVALKLGFVYQDKSVLKTDFEEIYTAPHKLILESLVGFYLFKTCESTDVNTFPLLDDKEWEEIRENEQLNNARKFAIGFLGANADKFLKNWITNSLSTYRSLGTRFMKLVKEEHQRAVMQKLIHHMNNSDIGINQDDICRSLRIFIYNIYKSLKWDSKTLDSIENENILFLIRMVNELPENRLDSGINMPIFDFKRFCNEIHSFEEKGKILAHSLVGVKDHENMLQGITCHCSLEVVNCFVAECENLNIKYDTQRYPFYITTPNATPKFSRYLLTHSPNLKRLLLTGDRDGLFNEAIQNPNRIDWKLTNLDISGSNIGNNEGTGISLASILNPKMTILKMRNCNLTGDVINEMMRECSCRRIELKLKELDISCNNLSSINATFLASILSSLMFQLDIFNCNLTGEVINDTMRECSNRGIKLKLQVLNISGNNLSSINATSLASLLPYITNHLDISNCNLTGEVVNDTMRECSSRGIKLNFIVLNISGNNLNNINATSLGSLFPCINYKLDISNCNLTGEVINDTMRECSSRGIKLNFQDLNISSNNLNSINATSLASLFPCITYELDISNCNLTGEVINDTMRECSSRGIKLNVQDLNISSNNLNSINATSLASSLASFYAYRSNLDISNCNLTNEVINDIKRECSRRKISLTRLEIVTEDDLGDP